MLGYPLIPPPPGTPAADWPNHLTPPPPSRLPKVFAPGWASIFEQATPLGTPFQELKSTTRLQFSTVVPYQESFYRETPRESLSMAKKEKGFHNANGPTENAVKVPKESGVKPLATAKASLYTRVKSMWAMRVFVSVITLAGGRICFTRVASYEPPYPLRGVPQGVWGSGKPLETRLCATVHPQ